MASWPFDSGDTTEQQYRDQFRRIQASGVWGDGSTTDLKYTTTNSNMTGNLAAGLAWVDGFMYQLAAPTILTHDAGTAQPRIDIVVIRADPSADTVAPFIIKGTAAASPVAPTPTRNESGSYDVVIAQVDIAASASALGPSATTDAREFMGLIYGLWATSRRPSAPRVGQAGYNTTLGYAENWTGSEWAPIARVAWADITGKPSTFTPASHNHASSEITSGTLDVARIPTLTAAKISDPQNFWGLKFDDGTSLPSAVSFGVGIFFKHT